MGLDELELLVHPAIIIVVAMLLAAALVELDGQVSAQLLARWPRPASCGWWYASDRERLRRQSAEVRAGLEASGLEASGAEPK